MITDVAYQQSGTVQPHHTALVATKALLEQYPDASFDSLCTEAMPMAETHQKCVEHLQTNVHILTRAQSIKRTNCGGITR